MVKHPINTDRHERGATKIGRKLPVLILSIRDSEALKKQSFSKE